ncbi:MAG TPA: glycosyltransferase family 2 protein [Burkholderiales bacterium]|nr:glycosyltransferase family 2 protein [Burkholderiales bacterium]
MRTAAVVIPAYNESATINDVVRRALAQLPLVIVVDDGSTDATAAALHGLPVVLLRNESNRGKAGSLRRGADEAVRRGADVIVTLDGDGQHRPEDIPLLLEAWRAAPPGIVIGSRLHARAAIPVARYCANRFANFWISWAAGKPIADTQSGFRVYPAGLFARARVRYGAAASFVFESEILIEAAHSGVEIVCVPINAIYSARARPSHFRPVVDIARIVRMVAWRLIARGLYLQGLVRSLRSR